MDDSAENIIKLAAFQAQDLPAELLTEDSAGRARPDRTRIPIRDVRPRLRGVVNPHIVAADFQVSHPR